MKKPSLLRGVLSFSSVTMLSRVFGLVRDIAINAVFGANAATDAFWVAFRIPNFMRRLFAEGSFSTAFVPVFTEFKETRSHAELKELTARVAGTLGGVLLVVTALGIFFAPQVALLFAPGAVHDPHKLDLTIELFNQGWLTSVEATRNQGNMIRFDIQGHADHPDDKLLESYRHCTTYFYDNQ